MADLRLVTPTTAYDWWGPIEHLVERAVGRLGVFSPADVKQLVIEGKWQIWTANGERLPSICCITDIVQYPDGRKALRVNNLGGRDLRKALHWMAYIQKWAANQGCHKTIADARPGVARLLRRAGWKQTAVTMEIANG